jgi:hypothetical protein
MDRLPLTFNAPLRRPEHTFFLSDNPKSIIFNITKGQCEIAKEQDKMKVENLSAELNFGSKSRCLYLIFPMDYSILTTPRAILDSGPRKQAPNDQGFDFVGRVGSIDVKIKDTATTAAIAELFINNSEAMAHSNAMSNAIMTAAYGVPLAVIGLTV